MNNKPNNMKIHEFNPVIYPYKVWIVIDKGNGESITVIGSGG